ncbi:MAG: hypothetical protein RLZZ157_972, partial [Pseudomonadota bacterium]
MTPDANLLATFPLLKGVSRSALRALLKGCAHYCVPSGSPLFLDKEPAQTLWFVVSGSLGAFRARLDGTSEFMGHIRQGEPVGEFALIAGELHSNSVFALRDSEVIGIGREAFEALIQRHTEVMTGLTRTILFRSRTNRRTNPRAEPRVFALLNTSPSIDILARAQLLAGALQGLGKTTLVAGKEAHHYNGAWFDEAERTHDIILLVSDSIGDNWAHVCQRRADRAWIFGRAETPPDFTLVEHGAAATLNVRLNDVVLVRSGQTSRTSSHATDWKKAAAAQRVFYWGDGDTGQLKSLARVMAGKSVGLVLGGGGARAYAHIGAVRAMREAGHSFDFVGGTSMGGVIAACLAMGWDDGEIERRIWDAFVRSSP